MTKTEFLALMRQIGLNPEDHNTGELHTAHLRLTGLFDHLEN